MLNTIELELKKKSLRAHCQKNEHFATGVLQQLCSTNFCLLSPSKTNRFSKIAFKFPLDTNEEFLNCILDCIELLSGEPIKLSVSSDNSDGYILGIKNSHLVGRLVELDASNPWCLAGLIFIDLNKNKKQDDNITIITSDLFKKNFFIYINKYNYLLL